MSVEYKCPICSAPGDYSPRYPRWICPECGKRAQDETGRPLTFSNLSMSGGFIAHYLDTGETYNSHICYVDGIRCWADEAHMGGIVVSIYERNGETK